MQLKVSQTRSEFACTENERATLRDEFDRRHGLLLQGFLDAALLDATRRRIAVADIDEVAYEVGREIAVKEERAKAQLEFLFNDPVLFEAIDALTGCGPIGCFSGRIYQMQSGGNHEFHWHTDMEHDRLIALSVNLGVEQYEGGLLEIAEATSRALLHRMTNLVPGDAIIFRISAGLMHRVTPVEGPHPKVAFAGWFRSAPAYRDVVQGWPRIIEEARTAASSSAVDPDVRTIGEDQP